MTITLSQFDFDKLASGGAAYIRVGPGLTATTVEVLEGKVFANYDPLGVLVGVEFLEPASVALGTKLNGKRQKVSA